MSWPMFQKGVLKDVLKKKFPWNFGLDHELKGLIVCLRTLVVTALAWFVTMAVLAGFQPLLVIPHVAVWMYWFLEFHSLDMLIFRIVLDLKVFLWDSLWWIWIWVLIFDYLQVFWFLRDCLWCIRNLFWFLVDWVLISDYLKVFFIYAAWVLIYDYLQIFWFPLLGFWFSRGL